MRGYLVQTLIALLGGLRTKKAFVSLTLEPNHASEKFDLLWEYPQGNCAVQVKSSVNPFAETDVRRWAVEMEASAPADEYCLYLVGLPTPAVAKLKQVGNVILKTRNLDLPEFFDQAAHRLDIFLRAEGLEPGTPEDREMLAHALTSRLAAYSTTGNPLTRADLVELLKTWVVVAPKKEVRVYLAKLPQVNPEFFGREEEIGLLDMAWADTGRTHIVVFVRWGGVGKTALVKRWLERVKADGWRGAQRVYGWSFYSQGTREDRHVSEEPFLADALQWFGVPFDPKLSSRDKGRLLADALARERTLLVLDGMEPLQHPPGPLAGQLRAPGLQTLLRQLATSGHSGLCILTTREAIRDIDEYRRTDEHPAGSVLAHNLGNLSHADGAQLLHRLGVRWAGAAAIRANDEELLQRSKELQGHALTLQLLGRYLVRAHQGDIRRWDVIDFGEADKHLKFDADNPYGHAFKVMMAYENWLSEGGKDGQRQLAVLRLMGLFDRRSDSGCLVALRQHPPIAGLTEPLVDLSDTDWNIVVHDLGSAGLLQILAYDAEYLPNTATLDVHPLIREYFAEQLRAREPDSWKQAHQRIADFLVTRVTQDLPEAGNPQSMEDLELLYRAASHYCWADNCAHALHEIYRRRISRGDWGYATRNYGCFGLELAMLRTFFESTWDRVVSGLPDEIDQMLVIRCTGFCLAMLESMPEALPLLSRALNIARTHGDSREAAIVARNLANFATSFGRLTDAETALQKNRTHADVSSDRFMPVGFGCSLAYVKFLMGSSPEDVMRLFEKAWDLNDLREEGAAFPELPTFQYHEVLIGYGKWRLVLSRVTEIETRLGQQMKPFGSALLQLSRVLAFLAGGQLDNADRHLREVRGLLDNVSRPDLVVRSLVAAAIIALKKLEGAKTGLTPAKDIYANLAEAEELTSRNHLNLLRVDVLLTRAWLRFLEDDTDGCRADLDEAWQIAERGSMRLHMADMLLHQARLFRDKAALAEAARLIKQCGYHRRDEELTNAQEAATGW